MPEKKTLNCFIGRVPHLEEFFQRQFEQLDYHEDSIVSFVVAIIIETTDSG